MKKKYAFDNQLSITDDLNELEVQADVISPAQAKKEKALFERMERLVDKDYIIRFVTPKEVHSQGKYSNRIVRLKDVKAVLKPKAYLKLLQKVYKGQQDKYSHKLRKSFRIDFSVR